MANKILIFIVIEFICPPMCRRFLAYPVDNFQGFNVNNWKINIQFFGIGTVYTMRI
ncbi:MAG: hypothetical protein ABFS56_18145 [Pseudomonadota bacterium]